MYRTNNKLHINVVNVVVVSSFFPFEQDTFFSNTHFTKGIRENFVYSRSISGFLVAVGNGKLHALVLKEC